MKKDIISQILWKIQVLATTKLIELFLWITISGAITMFVSHYLWYNNLNTFYFDMFLIIFVYYSCYKIILE
jgi:hypothetical protein